MTTKRSSAEVNPIKTIGAELNYNYEYSYKDDKPHQPSQIGEFHYDYDENGNLTKEYVPLDYSDNVIIDPTVHDHGNGVSGVAYGFGLDRDDNWKTEEEARAAESYSRSFSWDEENRLTEVRENSNTVNFAYDSEGNRTNKYTTQKETLYFDSMYSVSTEYPGNRESMNIYLGETRLATRLAYEHDETTAYEQINTYYYHGDHLGSANIVSDFEGGKYEHLEYTPYGELWVEDTDAAYQTPFRFTSKEWDEETELYYYGARYMHPRNSTWVSADPAGFELVNPMEQDKNGKLVAKQGYSLIEGVNWYRYCENNPVKYVDPSGMVGTLPKGLQKLVKATAYVYKNRDSIAKVAVGSMKFAGGVAIAIAGSSGGAGITVGTGGVATAGGVSVAVTAIVAGAAIAKDGVTDVLEGIQDLKKVGDNTEKSAGNIKRLSKSEIEKRTGDSVHGVKKEISKQYGQEMKDKGFGKNFDLYENDGQVIIKANKGGANLNLKLPLEAFGVD